MQINFTNGTRKIVLTKPERAALTKARDLAGELAKQTSNHVQQAALAAEAGLQTILAEFPAEAKSEPETAPADQTNERARTA